MVAAFCLEREREKNAAALSEFAPSVYPELGAVPTVRAFEFAATRVIRVALRISSAEAGKACYPSP